jgi:hypothetical protein
MPAGIVTAIGRLSRRIMTEIWAESNKTVLFIDIYADQWSLCTELITFLLSFCRIFALYFTDSSDRSQF